MKQLNILLLAFTVGMFIPKTIHDPSVDLCLNVWEAALVGVTLILTALHMAYEKLFKDD